MVENYFKDIKNPEGIGFDKKVDVFAIGLITGEMMGIELPIDPKTIRKQLLACR